jgi:hypothetical protein
MRSPLENWTAVKNNPTYIDGALTDSQGLQIKWHSPSDPRSSQVFCISAFGKLRSLPDRDELLNRLLTPKIADISDGKDWKLCFEHVNRQLLGETGAGMPTNIDVLCQSSRAVVCIESKFIVDARPR